LPILIVVILALVIPLSAQADGGDDGFMQTVNGYQVALIFAEDPTVGENQIHIQIHDAMDMPVQDASVEVILASVEEGHNDEASEAQSHDDMPAMEVAATEAPGHAGMAGMDMTAHQSETAHNEMQGIILVPAHESGEYSGTLHIESTGEWIISIELTVHGEVMEVGFPLTVKSGSRNGILAGFVGINILILIVAVALKPKSASK